MSLIDTYLANARTQRDLAAKTPLPNRKAMHERSAETWEDMARGASDTAARAAINLAAKMAAVS
uniref:Uncharacterized protein n=1 Tax=Sphingomonas sp. JE1 TaxID=1628059 RepID=A0A0D4ZZT0_9SPHN|nr:hypothetical protein pJE1_212 [Sphingomonas sp. JE1]